VRQAVFEQPMPPRLVRLFARVAGTQPVRRWQAAQVKPPPAAPSGRIEILATSPGPQGTPVPAPAPATAPAPTPALTLPPPPPPAASAAGRAPPKQAPVLPVAGRVDKREFAALLARLKTTGPDAAAAQKALSALTKQDLGPKRKRWEAWWQKHQDEERVEWLFDGLSHKTVEIRASAEEELRALTGEYFGYHFDLPKLEREEARVRWQASWYESHPGRRK
jgi:hypothetical protein